MIQIEFNEGGALYIIQSPAGGFILCPIGVEGMEPSHNLSMADVVAELFFHVTDSEEINLQDIVRELEAMKVA